MASNFTKEEVGEVNRSPATICEFEWRIPYFIFLSTETDKGYYSPWFSFARASWYLFMYPNGATMHNISGYISIYLMRVSRDPPISLEVSFSVKTLDGKKDQDSCCTECIIKKNTETYAVRRWISRAKLIDRYTELVPSNTLTVLCTLRNIEAAEAESSIETEICSHSKDMVNAEDLSSCEIIDKGSVKRKRTGDPWNELEEIACARIEENSWKRSQPCTSGSSTVCHHEKLLHNFRELFLKKEDCDVVIKVKGQEFPAHKVILQAQSPVLASTFRNDMKEKATGIVEIEDCDPSCFTDFLCFLYCGDIETISTENVFSLFTVADKYDVKDLGEKCIEFMKENLSIDTFCNTITLALRHCKTELIKLTTDFFIKNAAQIILSVNWQLFLAENPTQSNELFIKLLAPSGSSGQ